MEILAVTTGALLIVMILWDAFEAVVLPRRVARPLHLARALLETIWAVWSVPARQMETGRQRESYLSLYGPLAVLLLLAAWAVGLIVGFALLQWGFGSRLAAPEGVAGFATDLYLSGTTFFTLGLGDVAPISPLARALVVIEAGTGFGLLALVITYLPVLYQAFSRREARISMLDERAGSPPSALALLERLGRDGPLSAVDPYLGEWEHWAAELMETHLSYPILAYYRSQHENQSWLAALTVILDVSALVIVGVEGIPARPARLTFGMARHFAVDITQIIGTPPREPGSDRLPPRDLASLRGALATAGMSLCDDQAADERLAALRSLYEPYVAALADHLLMPLPPWLPAPEARDNWQTSAWE